MGTVRWLLTSMALSAIACAPSGPPKLPSEGGAAWIELTAPHFILRTDLDSEHARELIIDLEQIHDALEQAAFPPASQAPNRVLVVDFATVSEFRAYAPTNSAGFATSKLPNDLEEESALVLWGPLDETHRMSRMRVTHELTHELIHESFGGAPIWMNEGLAQYFSSAIVENGGVTLGDLPYEPGLPLPVSALPSAESIAQADRSNFRAATTYAQTTTDSELQTAIYYEGSWFLVHMLCNGPDDVTSRFKKVLTASARGESLGDAWNQIMVLDGYGWLNAKFRDYLKIEHLTLLHAAYQSRAANVRPAEREMSEIDTRLLWARIVDWKNEEGDRGLAQLEAAAKQDPNSPEVLYWRAIARLRRSDLNGAMDFFRVAISQAPKEPRYRLGLGVAQLRKYADEKSAQNLAEIGDTVAALEPIGTSPAQLAFLANWYDAKNKRDYAAELADRAMKLDPSCIDCVATRARIAFDDGSLEDAARLQRRAIALLPDGANDQPFQIVLREYQDALKVKATVPTGAMLTLGGVLPF